MAIYQSKKTTEDGRMGITHNYTSPKFKVRKEAVSKEAKYRLEVNQQKTNTTNPTFQDIFDEYYLNKTYTLKKQAMEYTDFKENWFIFGNALCFPETTIQKCKNNYCKLANVKQIH